MKRVFAFLLALALAGSLAACGAGKETTLTGMVVAVDGTVLSLAEMDGNGPGMNFEEFAGDERPAMPEGMEDFRGFEGGAFEGTLPEGETVPQWGEGEMPEMPQGGPMPEGGQIPAFEGEERPDFSGFGGDMETTEVDIGDAHISVEIEGGKASGTLEDIAPGVFVTITVDGRGTVTNVLVSSGFGSNFSFGAVPGSAA